MKVTPIVYEGFWVFPCPRCGKRHFCACYPPPIQEYAKASARVLPRSGESLEQVIRDEVRASWPSR